MRLTINGDPVMSDTKILLALERAMLMESKDALEYFTALNPMQKGAHWADALDMLMETDSHCDIREAMHALCRDQMPQGSWPYISPVVLTLIYANKGMPPHHQMVAYYAGRVEGYRLKGEVENV